MNKGIILVLLLNIFPLFGESLEYIESIILDSIIPGNTISIEKLVGVETDDYLGDISGNIGFTVIHNGKELSDFTIFCYRYQNIYLLIMTEMIMEKIEQITDVEIIAKLSEDEFLAGPGGFVDGIYTKNLKVITSSDAYTNEETLTHYRLVYAFDIESKSIIDVTNRDLTVYSDG